MFYKTIRIDRTTYNGQWDSLQITLFDKYGNDHYVDVEDNREEANETTATEEIIARFVEVFQCFKNLELKILQGFENLRESGRNEDWVEIPVTMTE